VTVRRAFKGSAAADIVAILAASGFGDASAQKRGSMPHVAILTPAPSAAAKPSWDAFPEAVKDFGYVEGKNVVCKYRSAEGQFDRFLNWRPSW
jgi:hypothetical protein